MSRAQYRKVYGKNGSGRFVVSEGIAPSTYLLAHPGLPTVEFDLEDDRFEIVIQQGMILSAFEDADGNTKIVPANGTGSVANYDDGEATPDTVTVPARSKPIGAAQAHAYRPFDKGTSLAVSWITRAFVEWPVVEGLNDDLNPGDLVRSDAIGRPVKCSDADAGTYPWLVVGKVIEVDNFATNFDDGLLSYMQLPSDPGALREVYAATKAGTYQGKLGIPANLDVAGVVGSVRVTLNV
jgi:hypothetical protein